MKPSTPTATYLEWWEHHGRKQKVAAETKEDGEAPVDDDSREMEATEAALDLVSQRDGRSRSASGRAGGGSMDADALISGVAKDMRRCPLHHSPAEHLVCAPSATCATPLATPQR